MATIQGAQMIDPNEVYTKLLKAADDWAELDGVANLLEETKKTLCAQLMLSNIRQGKSAASSECIALASDEYANHISAMVESRKHANKKKAALEAARAWFDAVRTVESTKRAEMNLR